MSNIETYLVDKHFGGSVLSRSTNVWKIELGGGRSGLEGEWAAGRSVVFEEGKREGSGANVGLSGGGRGLGEGSSRVGDTLGLGLYASGCPGPTHASRMDFALENVLAQARDPTTASL